MAKVNIVNVVVLDNPSPFHNPFQFEITFEALEDLSEDLEWKIIYVGAAESEEYDQTLETILVGPVPGGRHKFVFQAGPPDTAKIPMEDAVGVTVVLLTCSYRNKEFIRVGYYVNNEYDSPELKEVPPPTPQFDQLTRNILATNPRVTRFKIDWDDNQTENSENVPPETNMESESNQMCGDSMQQISKTLGEKSTMDQNVSSNTMNGNSQEQMEQMGCLFDGTMYNPGDTVMINPCLATMTCLGNYIYSDPVSLGGVCPDKKRAVDGQTGCLFNGKVYSANESIIIQPCLAEMTCLGHNSYSDLIALGGDCRKRRNANADGQLGCSFNGQIYSKGDEVMIQHCLAKFTCLGNNLISQPIQLHGQC